MRIWLCFFLAVMWAAAGCAPSPKIGYDFDRSTDFSAYHTYACRAIRKRRVTGAPIAVPWICGFASRWVRSYA